MSKKLTRKVTNPKDALGVKKVPMHCIPTAPLLELALAMMEGGRKYGAHNYRVMGAKASTYYDAACRHLTAWWDGEDIDKESGVHHLIKLCACMFVMRDSQHMGNDIDDRPKRYPNGLDLEKFNKQAADIIEMYSKCKPPFTHKEIDNVE